MHLLTNVGPPDPVLELSVRLIPGNVLLTWLSGYPGCQISTCKIVYYEVTAAQRYRSSCAAPIHTFETTMALFDTNSGQFVFSPCAVSRTGQEYYFNVTAVNERGRSNAVESSTQYIGELTIRIKVHFNCQVVTVIRLLVPPSSISVELISGPSFIRILYILDSFIQSASECELRSGICNIRKQIGPSCSACVIITDLHHSQNLVWKAFYYLYGSTVGCMIFLYRMPLFHVHPKRCKEPLKLMDRQSYWFMWKIFNRCLSISLVSLSSGDVNV